MIVVNDAVARALQELAQPQFADLQRLVAHIHAIVHEEIERIKPHLFVARSTVQALEIGDPVRPEHNGLTVYYE